MTDRKLQYSTFIGKDQLVIRADSVEDLVKIVNALAGPEDGDTESAYSEILNATQRIKAAGLVGMNPALDVTSPTAPSVRAQAPSQRPAATSGDGKACPTCSGAMELRSGGGGDTGKKPWKGWFCLADKKHSPVWVK